MIFYLDTGKFFCDKNFEIFRVWINPIIKLLIEHRLNVLRKK